MLYNIILPIDHFPTGGGEWVADRISSLDDDSLLANSVRAHERFREACERTHTTQLTRRLADLKDALQEVSKNGGRQSGKSVPISLKPRFAIWELSWLVKMFKLTASMQWCSR